MPVRAPFSETKKKSASVSTIQTPERHFWLAQITPTVNIGLFKRGEVGKNFRVWFIRLQHMTKLQGKENWSGDQRFKNVLLATSWDMEHFKAYGFNLF